MRGGQRGVKERVMRECRPRRDSRWHHTPDPLSERQRCPGPFGL